ncbi:MAG TPA: alanine racemase [Rhizobiaceae bacterium]|nr:alanine racemase [Rhizobiaceae bacterium]
MIDLCALAENWRAMAKRSNPARCGAAVKADAYGLGLEPAMRALAAAGCQDFFVATVDEAARARAIAPGAEIFVLNGVSRGETAQALRVSAVPVLASMAQVAVWKAAAAQAGRPLTCALQVDTGMNRLGVTRAEAMALAADPAFRAALDLRLVMSHLACADEPGDPMTAGQLELFRPVAAAFDHVPKSLCNSAGVFLGGDFLFDLTRPGIALYGGEAVNGMAPLKPVVTAQARIVQIRHAKAGETVGYGAAHRLERDSRLAVCAVGYADGYLRAGSGSGVGLRQTVKQGARGWIAGAYVPVVGRISMDLTVFDLTDLPEGTVQAEDWVELLGPHVALDDAARAAGTIGYELLTSLGRRYCRQYTGDFEGG